MRSTVMAMCSLLLAATATVAEPPATRPAATAPATAPGEAENPFIINDVPISQQPAIPLGQVVRFRIVDDSLVVETTLPPHMPQMIRVVGLAQPLEVGVTMRGAVPAGAYQPDQLQLTYVHLDSKHPLRTNLATTVGQISIFRDMVFPDGTEKTVQFIQNPIGDRPVSLWVQTMATDGTSQPENASAESFAAFMRKHPKATSDYLRPMIETFGPQPHLFAVSDSIAFTVFPEAYLPTPQEQEKVRELVSQLGDESYPTRQAAGAQLEKLGVPAAAVLLHIDRAALQPEQATRIDAILAHARPHFDTEPAKLRTDPGFLLDCVLSSNSRLRQVALAQLKSVTGESPDLPAGLSDEQRIERVYKLRSQLVPAATQTSVSPAKPQKAVPDTGAGVRDTK